MFPLIGFLFGLFCLGIVLGLGALVPSIRGIAVPAAAALVLGSTSACVLSLGLSVGAEAAFSTPVGEMGFFIGYIGGLMVGGYLGAAAGRRWGRASCRTMG